MNLIAIKKTNNIFDYITTTKKLRINKGYRTEYAHKVYKGKEFFGRGLYLSLSYKEAIEYVLDPNSEYVVEYDSDVHGVIDIYKIKNMKVIKINLDNNKDWNIWDEITKKYKNKTKLSKYFLSKGIQGLVIYSDCMNYGGNQIVIYDINCVKKEKIKLKGLKMNLIAKNILMSAKINYSDLKESLTNQFQELAKLSRKEDKTPYRQAVRALNKLNIRQFIRRVKEDKWDDINIPPKMVKEFIEKGRIKELGRTAKRQGKKPLSKKTKIARKRIIPVVNYITKIFRNAKRIEPAGSYRRGTGMLGDLEFVIAGMTSKKIMDTIEASRKLRVVQTLWKGKSKIGLQVATSFPGIPTMQLEFKLSSLKYFGGGLLESTGSKVFNIKLRMLAKRKDFKLNQYGIWKNKKLIASKTEKAIFKILGLDYILPENREDLLI